jgi:hypothetical protein
LHVDLLISSEPQQQNRRQKLKLISLTVAANLLQQLAHVEYVVAGTLTPCNRSPCVVCHDRLLCGLPGEVKHSSRPWSLASPDVKAGGDGMKTMTAGMTKMHTWMTVSPIPS